MMDSKTIRETALAYLSVYDQDLREEMEELGIIDEARDGYGDDSKFNKPDDKIEKPGTTVPKPKKGGYGRISRSTPYGIGAHANRIQSAVTRTVGEDEGAPRSVKIAKEKPARKIVKKGGKWVKESQEFQLWINSLLDEGYDLSDYTLDEMVEIYEGKKPRPTSRMAKQARRLAFSLGTEVASDEGSSGNVRHRDLQGAIKKLARFGGKKVKHHIKRGYEQGTTYDPYYHQPISRAKEKAREEMDEGLDYYDVVLTHLLDEGYADTYETAEAIMVNMSEEWIDDIIEEFEDIVESEYDYKDLPRRRMINKSRELRASKNPNKKARAADIEYQLRAHSPEASKTSSYINTEYGRG